MWNLENMFFSGRTWYQIWPEHMIGWDVYLDVNLRAWHHFGKAKLVTDYANDDWLLGNCLADYANDNHWVNIKVY